MRNDDDDGPWFALTPLGLMPVRWQGVAALLVIALVAVVGGVLAGHMPHTNMFGR